MCKKMSKKNFARLPRNQNDTSGIFKKYHFAKMQQPAVFAGC